MEVLGKLFGSSARVKILRLFLFNSEKVFEKRDVVQRTRAWPETVGSELATLKAMGFIKRKSCYRERSVKRGSKSILKKKKIIGWALNPKFRYLNALRNFLVYETSPKKDDIAKRLRGVPSLKLVVATGVFIQDLDSKIDLLVVGNTVKTTALESAIRRIEVDLGKELRYAYFTAADFKYRLSMYDRLLRDIFDYPHHIVINKFNEVE